MSDTAEALTTRPHLWGRFANDRRYNPVDTIGTPWDLFESLDREFHFTLDVCALPENAKCVRYFTPDDDGLKQQWSGACWMNPPYSQINRWMRKAFEASRHGATVVCLVPVRSDLGWWHDYAMQGEIRFLRGRLTFYRQKWHAPFPSAIVIFRPVEMVP